MISESYFRDSDNRCPRCGRSVYGGGLEWHRDSPFLPSRGTCGEWGYIPDAALPLEGLWQPVGNADYRHARCGDGWHVIPKEDWRPSLDGPFPGYPRSNAAETATVRDTPVYSDFDPEAGF